MNASTNTRQRGWHRIATIATVAVVGAVVLRIVARRRRALGPTQPTSAWRERTAPQEQAGFFDSGLIVEDFYGPENYRVVGGEPIALSPEETAEIARKIAEALNRPQ